MKIKRIDNKRKEKILTSGVITSTAVLLGLYLNNGTVVKADSLPNGQDITQTSSGVNTEAGSSAIQNENNATETGSTGGAQTGTNTGSSNSADQNENSLTETETTNGIQTGTTTFPTDETTGQTKNQANELTRSVKNYNWNGLSITYDNYEGMLTIPGGTDANPVELTDPAALKTIANIYQVKEIVINGKIKINGSAAHLFSDLRSLYRIIGLENLDTSNVENMSSMFSGCMKLTSFDLSKFDTSKVTDMSYMFQNCMRLTSLDVKNFNTANVTNMSWMFSGCKILENLDISVFDTANVTNMQGMFESCNKLPSLNLTNFDTASVTNMSRMFENCNTISNLDVSEFNTSNVEDMWNMFVSCSALTAINIKKFDTSKVTNMASMFSGCKSLTSLDVSAFDTANVEGMELMFSGCEKLTSLDLSKFVTSKVKYMTQMFDNCRSLTSLKVSNFDTSNVTNMDNMFDSCIALAKLDLSSFNTSKVRSMQGMFSSCLALTELDLRSFNTSNVHAMGRMFNGCKNLTRLNISSFDMSNLDGRIPEDGDIIDDDQDRDTDDDHDTDSDEEANLLTEGMLRGLPKLRILVLGPKCTLQKSDLNEDAEDAYGDEEILAVDPNSKWVNLAGGTLTNAKGNKLWTPTEMMANYNGSTDADTYIRFGVVKAHFQDTKGNKISEDEDIRGLTGEDYDTVGKKEIPGYTYKEARGDVTGTYDENLPKEVTYIYTKKPGNPVVPVKSKVIVHYQDENGNQIASDEVLTGKVGDGYQTMQKTIPGYTFKEVRGNATGFFTSNEQTVIYIYNKESNENNITELPNPNNVHKPTRPNKLATNKLKPNRPFKLKRSIPKARKNNLQPKAINSKTDPLPQTGSNKKDNRMLISLGGAMLLIGLLGGVWSKRKKH